MSRHPTVKWAQRSDKVYITVELPDAKDVKLKLEPDGKFNFSATKDGTPYEVELELFDKVNVEESKYNIGVRSIVYVIKKDEKKWWIRLVKQEGKPPVFLKVDWDKWVDEDENNERAGMDFDDMDFSKLDMGGDDDFDMDEAKDEEEGEEAKEEDESKKAPAEVFIVVDWVLKYFCVTQKSSQGMYRSSTTSQQEDSSIALPPLFLLQFHPTRTPQHLCNPIIPPSYQELSHADGG